MPDGILRPLGRHLEHDPRSLRFAHQTSAVTLVSVRHQRHAPVFDQGELGSCTGNACLGAIGTSPVYDSLLAFAAEPSLDEATAVKLYSLATTLDSISGSYPPEDTGSSGIGVAKAAVKDGWLSGYTHALGIDAALDALCDGPVITGVDWYDSFDNPLPSGEMPLPKGASVRGGHELVVDEIDVERKRVWITNSWGEGWSLNGRAWWSWDTWTKLLKSGGDVTVLIPVTAPAPQPTPVPVPGPPSPGPAASFHCSPEAAARVVHAATSAHPAMTGDEWLEHHLRGYFHMPPAS